jgi:murein DD-endopeptidase MepM/ murein hydrolase activator NlpD
MDRPEAPETSAPLATRTSMTLPAVEQAPNAPNETLHVTAEDFTGPDWLETKIKRGDTLASIFSGFGLSPAIVHKVVNSSQEAQSLSRIRPGQTLRLKVGDDNTLICVVHETSRTSGLRLARLDDGSYRAEQYEHPVDKRIQFATATIEESLYLAAQRAGMSDRLTMNVAEIFGWDVDFALDIRPGDSFSVLYEEEFLNGEKLRDGAILAAEFNNQGRRFGAIRYTDDEGYSEYFTPEGYSMRKAFLKTPVKFARVSSGFTRKRWHPVLKKWRAHKGVDYAAQTGTPIRATGDGKLTFVGRKGGYGKVVFIQHGGKYTTVYAHMSRFAKGMKSGTRVRQGQVIGYVGKTGYATGPHLHYEFRVNGAHKDPLKVKLPKSDPIADRHRTSFMQVAETRTNQLKTYQATQVALTD